MDSDWLPLSPPVPKNAAPRTCRSCTCSSPSYANPPAKSSSAAADLKAGSLHGPAGVDTSGSGSGASSAEDSGRGSQNSQRLLAVCGVAPDGGFAVGVAAVVVTCGALGFLSVSVAVSRLRVPVLARATGAGLRLASALVFALRSPRVSSHLACSAPWPWPQRRGGAHDANLGRLTGSDMASVSPPVPKKAMPLYLPELYV